MKNIIKTTGILLILALVTQITYAMSKEEKTLEEAIDTAKTLITNQGAVSLATLKAEMSDLGRALKRSSGSEGEPNVQKLHYEAEQALEALDTAISNKKT
jgi:hypothetical protein